MAVVAATIAIPVTSTLNRTPKRRPRLANVPSEWMGVTKLTGDTSATFTFPNLKTVFAAEYYGLDGVLIAAATSVTGNTATFTGTLGAGLAGVVIATGNNK